MRPAAESETPEAPQNHWKTLKTLSRHLWPKGRSDLRARVVLAMLFLLGARLVSVYVPVIYKDAVDALSPTRLCWFCRSR